MQMYVDFILTVFFIDLYTQRYKLIRQDSNVIPFYNYVFTKVEVSNEH